MRKDSSCFFDFFLSLTYRGEAKVLKISTDACQESFLFFFLLNQAYLTEVFRGITQLAISQWSYCYGSIYENYDHENGCNNTPTNAPIKRHWLAGHIFNVPTKVFQTFSTRKKNIKIYGNAFYREKKTTPVPYTQNTAMTSKIASGKTINVPPKWSIKVNIH